MRSINIVDGIVTARSSVTELTVVDEPFGEQLARQSRVVVDERIEIRVRKLE